MVVFRPTVKLAKKMGVILKPSNMSTQSLLGDWFSNDLSIFGKRFVLSVSSTTRIHVLTQAAPYKDWVKRFPTDLLDILEKLEIPNSIIEQEIKLFKEPSVFKSNNRSVMGTVTDGIKCLKHYQAYPASEEDVISSFVDRLNNTPIQSLEETWPEYQLRKVLNLPRRSVLQ